MKVFPYVMSLPDILMGSSQPIVLIARLLPRACRTPASRPTRSRASISTISCRYLQAPVIYGPGEGRDSQAETNTDLFPRDEYDFSPIFGRRKSRHGPVTFGGVPV